MLRTSALGVAMAVVAVAAVAAPRGHEDFDWSGTVAAGAAVEIKGVNGAIVATGSDSGQVEVTATRKGRRSDPSAVEIRVVEHERGVTICAVYPSSGVPNECTPGEGGRMRVQGSDVVVEFRVKVPAGVNFVGRTISGGIVASGIEADAEAHTVDGDVRMDAAGVGVADTVNGAISARMGGADWEGALRLKTVNGGIEVLAPAGSRAYVRASTVNGEIRNDFSLAASGRSARRRLEGAIGGGGRPVELETVNGGIDLRRAGRPGTSPLAPRSPVVPRV
jgi:hypothetical protein